MKTDLIHIINKLLVLPGVFFLFQACENEIEKIQTLTNASEIPELSGKKVEMIYSDSAKVKLKLNADEIRRFSNLERPYIEFPKGMVVRFYDDSLDIQTRIVANYAIYYNEEKLWEARGNVVAENFRKQEKLNTEQLFWDENKGIIYSDSYSRIENPDGTFYGENGFEANERFTRWRLKGSRGTVNYRDEKPKE